MKPSAKHRVPTAECQTAVRAAGNAGLRHAGTRAGAPAPAKLPRAGSCPPIKPAATPTAPPLVSCTPTLVPQGDGCYLIKPGKPVLARIRLSVRQAGARAKVSKQTVYRLFEAGFLEGERPSPHRTLIFEDSLDAHLAHTRDQEFWDAERRRDLYKEKL